MFPLFATNVRLARPVLTVAKYAFLNPVTRSFITSSRVADAEPKAASSEPTIEKKSKREKKDSKPQQKDKPKIIVITKDVKPPKRPLTPYTRFVKEYYDTHPKTFSREGIATEMKRCGADWNALSDAAKATYTEGYNEALEEHRKKRAAWAESIDPAVAKEINKARKAAGKKAFSFKFKASGRPLTPYIRFFKQFHPDQEITSTGGRGRLAGEAWRSMSQDEKQQYFDSFAREKDEWLARKASDKA